ncbi:uncharacterized protein LOC107791192 isoform X5 [Nicotiana tabacum]|uniref:Uncharacterized protein LOC107791192 isoform X5 n=2 Tax=Nicotiana TaxID=4085 RepID=A0A1S3ZW95_TOBAC|nr:PREDICTED: uncharacterized protein LOC104231263 isoform X3 [Nicotiana sylvestris]XP_016468695.1 PREDICTED: uncharacterized protein LOC107791192 isoform X3 [Nicotiana tabacum]
MAKEGPNWDGLLKWSLSHADGTNPTRNLSEEDRRWFMEAMQAQTVDVVKRMKEITLVMQTPEQVLESQGVTSQDIEDMLDELQEHVESIDMANGPHVNMFMLHVSSLVVERSVSMSHIGREQCFKRHGRKTRHFTYASARHKPRGTGYLHSIGGLVPLLGYLKNSHANIRAKAAEVVSTIVQNNPKSQQLVMEANGLESLLSNFTSDPDVTARTKALGAISSLIRHNKLGIAAFRLANGYAALRDALSSESVRFQSIFKTSTVGSGSFLFEGSIYHHVGISTSTNIAVYWPSTNFSLRLNYISWTHSAYAKVQKLVYRFSSSSFGRAKNNDIP